MRAKQGLARGKVIAPAVAFGMLLLLSASQAHAVLLFWENFEGYNYFPDQKPVGDYVNLGLPQISEGAAEVWYGGRFQSGGGSLGRDLGVQRWGGSGNGSHTGRFGDNAGMFLKLSTIGHDNVELSFDWRTFLAEGSDRLRVGYYAGGIGFGGDRLRDFSLLGPAWSQWTQVVAGQGNSWRHENVALPGGSSDLWVAFWMQGGDLDLGKVDNVRIRAQVDPVPEPASLILLGGGLLALAARGMRKKLGS
jgi:hypothetical protein